MQPTPEIDAFIERVKGLPAGPGVSLDAVLQPSLDEETELRKLFATDRQNARITNPHVGLVDVFEAPDALRTTRARVIQDKDDLVAKYVMPITAENRRAEGAASMVPDLDEFKKNWAIFTEGSLSQLLDWNNVVAAGGSVLACLTPLEEEHKKSKRAVRKFYHSNAYPTSDVDLFLWGMDAEQAEAKIKTIYEAVRDSVPWDVTCIRTKHTVSIHSQYPYRCVQIILRLYHSPAEILAGFDIDAPCCAYDGNSVWANPRSVVAMMRQCNTVDMSRRSPSYEVRLAKYSRRFYEVYVPTLVREKIDPTIYERSIAKMEGLARLLVLEKLTNDNMRATFLQGRRELRGRPDSVRVYSWRDIHRLKGDLKFNTEMGVEMNDYDVTSLHIPYGPGWDSKKIKKLVYQTDLGMNSTYNPKNKGRRLHRHPAFFGTVYECIKGCCKNCPTPVDEDEKSLQGKEDEAYIRGRIAFIQENPGRQTMTGSFNPVDEGEWSDQVYIKPTEQLFMAIAAHDRAKVQEILQKKDELGVVDLNHRDHVGRTSLHIAIVSKAVDIANDLIDAGARITARLADGRAPLHLAAQYDLTSVIKKLLERSEKNKAELETKDGKDEVRYEVMDGKDPETPSSEDVWGSHKEGLATLDQPEKDKEEYKDGDKDKANNGDEDEEERGRNVKAKTINRALAPPSYLKGQHEEPDIIEVNMPDWDFGFSALCYATPFSSLLTVETLLAAGAQANVKLATKPSSPFESLYPLTLTIFREDEDEACSIARQLLKAGATSYRVNRQMYTIFHAAVSSKRIGLVETILRYDPHASDVLNFPSAYWGNVTFPISTAIQEKSYAIIAVMLAYGVKLELEEADATRAYNATPTHLRGTLFGSSRSENYLHLAYQPIEIALQQHDEITKLLVTLGATVNVGLKHALSTHNDAYDRQTVKDWVDYAELEIAERMETLGAEGCVAVTAGVDAEQDVEMSEAESTSGWKAFHMKYMDTLVDPNTIRSENGAQTKRARELQECLARMQDLRNFFIEVKTALSERGAKSWSQVYPHMETKALVKTSPSVVRPVGAAPKPIRVQGNCAYVLLSTRYNRRNVSQHLLEAYDDLYEACYAGDNEKIQKLCLPKPGQVSAADAPSLLNISVEMTRQVSSTYSYDGYTPLFAAVAARRWSTAKLILAIATAQYHPDDDEEHVKFDVDFKTDEDSDSDSYDSDSSDISIAQKRVTFIDVATRPSMVQSDAHPRLMLDAVTHWRKPQPSPSEPPLVGPNNGTSNIITKSVINHDLEAFVHISNLYNALPQPIPLPDLLLSIFEQDQPDILDEYIRRTSAGIHVIGAQKSSGNFGPIPAPRYEQDEDYRGLDVHWKNCGDLPRNNINGLNISDNNGTGPPILWNAVRQGAKAIVSYLASDRPLAAYRFYAKTHKDDKALWLRRLGTAEGGEVEKQLGWTANVLGESPLSAAIIGGDLSMLRLLTNLKPKLIAQALQTNIKFLGINLLHLAVRTSKNVKVVKYLLSRKVSPSEKDPIRGWNIYHYICENNSGDLLELCLQTLPRDVNESLLVQTSKLRQNTPLLVAVKKGHRQLVELILEYSKNAVLLADVDGQTPLHCAVASSYALIVKLLLDAAPPRALHIENSAGITPLEMARLKKLVAHVKESSEAGQNSTFGQLRAAIVANDPDRIQTSLLDKYNIEFGKIHLVRDVIVDQGTLKDSEKANLKTELTRWVSRAGRLVRAKERKADEEKKAQEAEKSHKTAPNVSQPVFYACDKTDVYTTLHNINAAIKTSTDSITEGGTPYIGRELIRLLDVQQSVGFTLSKANPRAAEGGYNDTSGLSYPDYCRQKFGTYRNGDEEPEKEVDEDFRIRKNSMVFGIVSTRPDPL